MTKLRTVIKVNLIRDQVDSRGRRKVIHLAMLLYLAACGVGLVWVVYGSTLRVLNAQDQWREATAMRVKFRMSHPGEKDAAKYARSLHGELKQYAETLSAIERALGERVAVDDILFGLVNPLPPHANLYSFTLDGKKQEVAFEIVAPVSVANGVTSRDLLKSWETSGALHGRLKNISPVSSDRRTIGGEVTLVMRFTGTLAEGT